jgi:hypothetical protein
MTGGIGRLSISGHLGTWRGWLLLASVVLATAVAIFAPSMPQPPTYHVFADRRTLWSIPNFFNVVSNLPFLVGGAAGLLLIWNGGGSFVERRERLPYLVFFLGALLTSFGSSWYHLAPDNARLVWDRLPMTLGFAGLVCAALAERADLELGLSLLWGLLLLGAGTVFWWYLTEQRGAGNVIPYAAFQGWSVLVIVMLIACFPAFRYSHGGLLVWSAGWYGLAKGFEAYDLDVYHLTAATLSGHTIKHLLAASAVFAVLRQLRLRRAHSDPTLALPQ